MLLPFNIRNQIYQGPISDSTCINIPLDIETCNDCSTINLTLFSDITSQEDFLYNGNIQIIKNIPVYISDEFEKDNTGPIISLLQEKAIINEGSMINKTLPLTLTLDDQQGINFMDVYQHNVRYWFNSGTPVYNIHPTSFTYSECGKASADFTLPGNLDNRNNTIHIEAWDNGNNRTLINYNFTLSNNEDSYVTNLYNFPNPFKNSTFFTFYLSSDPEFYTQVTIDIYNIQGKKIKTLEERCNQYYNTIYWDGKTDQGLELSNGPYIYSFNSNHPKEWHKTCNNPNQGLDQSIHHFQRKIQSS